MTYECPYQWLSRMYDYGDLDDIGTYKYASEEVKYDFRRHVWIDEYPNPCPGCTVQRDPKGDTYTFHWYDDIRAGYDAVNPGHYKFSDGVELISITENLTGNGAQAVQYIARATRIDGHNKGNIREDLEKARWFIDRELRRLS